MALVVFLRGVNVGGHRTFRPSILAQQLKHYDAINVGAAGTFVIRKPANQAELRSELQRRLPFETEVMICSGQDLITMASGDPFGNKPIHSDVVRFVSVLAKRPRVLPSLPLSLPADGAWLLRILATENRFIFGMYRRHMKAIRYLRMIDTLFGVPATTRNWNTFTAIIKVLKSGREDSRNTPKG
jgi:uncharacterized protein (DUF1697 family)